MRQRFIVLLAVLAVISGLSQLQAQGPAPTAYTIYEDPGFSIMGKMTVKLSRDGSKEVVDQIMPAGPGHPKEYHGHLVYNFQAHTLYTAVLSDPGVPCGAQAYTDPTAPPEFDVIAGADALIKELSEPGAKSTDLGTEVLNGIPTRVVAISSAKANAKVWYAQKGGYPLKIDVTEQDGKLTHILEVKQISYAKPPASAFTLPPSCQGVEVPPPPPVASTNVKSLTLAPIGNYTGPCPAHVKVSGTITVDGPGTVFYQFGAGTFNPGKTIVFSAAGTKTVTDVFTFQPKYGNQMGGMAILEAIGADAQGNHGMLTQGSNNSDFKVTCTSGGGK
jgi:hypothetical protein